MKKWTVMAYLAGDNNLSEDMVTALRGMQSIGGNDAVGVLAFFDSAHPFTPSSYYNFTQETREKRLEDCRVKVNPDNKENEELTNEKALVEFVKWAKKNHPAEKYALILSGHGDGFLGKVLLRDENPAGFITLQQLRKTLEQINTSILGKKLNILGFDSCVMNMLEVSFELRQAARVLVASEGLLPNSGWAYDKVLRHLVETNGDKKTKEYARDFVSQFIKFHGEYAVGGRSVDLSACDLTAIDQVALSVGVLGDVLRNEFPPLPKDNRKDFGDDDEKAEYKNPQTGLLVREYLKKAILGTHWDAQTYLFDQAIDVADFSRNLLEQCHQIREEIAVFNDEPLETYEPESENGRIVFERLGAVETACGNVLDAVDEFVIKSSYTGSEYQFSNGVSMFFPWSLLGYMVILDRYKKLEFNRTTDKKWLSFLSRYLYETMREPRGTLANVENEGSVLTESGKLNPESSRLNLESSRLNPESSRLNPESSRLNPESSRLNPESSRLNPESSRLNPESSRLNPESSRGSGGELGAFLRIFARTKNVPFNWISPKDDKD